MSTSLWGSKMMMSWTHLSAKSLDNNPSQPTHHHHHHHHANHHSAVVFIFYKSLARLAAILSQLSNHLETKQKPCHLVPAGKFPECSHPSLDRHTLLQLCSPPPSCFSLSSDGCVCLHLFDFFVFFSFNVMALSVLLSWCVTVCCKKSVEWGNKSCTALVLYKMRDERLSF